MPAQLWNLFLSLVCEWSYETEGWGACSASLAGSTAQGAVAGLVNGSTNGEVYGFLVSSGFASPDASMSDCQIRQHLHSQEKLWREIQENRH